MKCVCKIQTVPGISPSLNPDYPILAGATELSSPADLIAAITGSPPQSQELEIHLSSGVAFNYSQVSFLEVSEVMRLSCQACDDAHVTFSDLAITSPSTFDGNLASAHGLLGAHVSFLRCRFDQRSLEALTSYCKSLFLGDCVLANPDFSSCELAQCLKRLHIRHCIGVTSLLSYQAIAFLESCTWDGMRFEAGMRNTSVYRNSTLVDLSICETNVFHLVSTSRKLELSALKSLAIVGCVGVPCLSDALAGCALESLNLEGYWLDDRSWAETTALASMMSLSIESCVCGEAFVDWMRSLAMLRTLSTRLSSFELHGDPSIVYEWPHLSELRCSSTFARRILGLTNLRVVQDKTTEYDRLPSMQVDRGVGYVPLTVEWV